MTGFSKSVRESIRAGAQSSAAVLVPIISDLVRTPAPRTMIDVGCGEGWFASEFHQRGWSVLGVDHPDTEVLALTSTQFVAHDLAEPLNPGPGWDLAVSLEVAEHLPPERAASFVAELCRAAPIVVFSAAIPGQGGTGHLNEQWPGYWSDLFDGHGFICSGYLRHRIWDDDRIENWYRQNLLVAVKAGGTWGSDFFLDSPPQAVVHPVLWEAYRCT